MSSIPLMSKIGTACKAVPTFNIQCVRTLISSNVCLKTSDHSGKKGSNGLYSNDSVPRNIEEINSSVKAKFSPHRTRDSSSARIEVKMNQPSGTFGSEFMGSQGSKAGQKINTRSRPSDSHVEVYDASNSVSLSSVMQSNVPKPFETKGTEAPAHLGMPGGQWSQGDKYVSGDLHDHHHDRNVPKKFPGIGMGQTNSMYTNFPKKYTGMGHSNTLFFSTRYPLVSFLPFDTLHRAFATNTSSRGFCFAAPPSANNQPLWRTETCYGRSCVSFPLLYFVKDDRHGWKLHRKLTSGSASFIHSSPVAPNEAQKEPEMTQRQKLRRVVKEYGSTVVVFHVAISLASLGFFYLLVSSGIDMSGVIERLGINLASLEQTSSSAPSSVPPSGEFQAPSEPPSEEVQGPASELPKPPQEEEEGRKKVKAVAVAAGVSTFVLSYAIHKVFAPVRMAVTLTATPFIVRRLRKIGFLKPPKTI